MSEQAAALERAKLAESFMRLVTGHWVAKAVETAAELGLADRLREGPRGVEDLAAESGAHAPTLRRLLRALASVGVFAEDAEGRFGMTPLAEFLQTGPGSIRGMTRHLLERPSWEAWGDLSGSVRTGETAFARVHGTEVFPYYAAHPESAEPFNAAMVELSGVVSGAVARAYDFSRFEKIVDVGGGHGGLLTEILKANPRARGVVFDQPAVVEGARARIEREGLAGRCEAEGGDFFESVTAGGDCYLLKWIIHDWDDARALPILRNVRRAMAGGGRLLLVESVVPEGNEPSFSKWMDLQMLVMTGGRERTRGEYAALLAASGFELARVVETDSPVSVLEAVAA